MIAIELVLVVLLLINLATGSEQQLQALEYLTKGGGYAVAFWGAFFVFGLLVPLVVEVIDLVACKPHTGDSWAGAGADGRATCCGMSPSIWVRKPPGKITTHSFSAEALDRVNKHYENGIELTMVDSKMVHGLKWLLTLIGISYACRLRQ